MSVTSESRLSTEQTDFKFRANILNIMVPFLIFSPMHILLFSPRTKNKVVIFR